MIIMRVCFFTVRQAIWLEIDIHFMIKVNIKFQFIVFRFLKIRKIYWIILKKRLNNVIQ